MIKAKNEMGWVVCGNSNHRLAKINGDLPNGTNVEIKCHGCREINSLAELKGFQLGDIVATIGASNLNRDEVKIALNKHANCDWGDTNPADAKLNDEVIATSDGRIFSVYHTSNGIKFWIITEWDRSYTTVLLPNEY